MNKQEYREYLESIPLYERNAVKLYSEVKDIDDQENCVKVISYFCKREGNSPEVSGKVFKAHETHYNKKFETNKAIAYLNDKMLTKRGALRKTMLDLKPYEIYDYSALHHYLNQALKDNCRYVLLSAKEVGMILPQVIRRIEEK